MAAKKEMAPELQRMAIVQRIVTVIERQIDAVERIVDSIKPTDQIEADREARPRAMASRTLRDTTALSRPEEETPFNDVDDEPIPRDIDEFRLVLMRRIEALVAGRQSAVSR